MRGVQVAHEWVSVGFGVAVAADAHERRVQQQGAAGRAGLGVSGQPVLGGGVRFVDAGGAASVGVQGGGEAQPAQGGGVTVAELVGEVDGVAPGGGGVRWPRIALQRQRVGVVRGVDLLDVGAALVQGSVVDVSGPRQRRGSPLGGPCSAQGSGAGFGDGGVPGGDVGQRLVGVGLRTGRVCSGTR
ncbi:hypothetical protein AB0K00_54155 [Dactylosporangium sp. NPDC049525]|uniref:hypothetical protein n=1 Tax=Dactylosporangium sp. NPDC049525 TaxID=3154730 RepID=UPI00342E71F5